MGETRSLVLKLETLMKKARVPHNRFEYIRVFLVYLSRNYKWIMPYLKVLHLKIDG